MCLAVFVRASRPSRLLLVSADLTVTAAAFLVADALGVPLGLDLAASLAIDCVACAALAPDSPGLLRILAASALAPWFAA